MDKYPYRVYAEIESEGLPNHQKVLPKLQIYFQSKKKSGGGDCVVEFGEKENSATIGFKQEEVLSRVLLNTQHEITIDNKQLKIYLTTERKSESTIPPSGSQSSEVKGTGSQFQDPQHEGASASDSDVQEERAEEIYQPKAVVVENIPEDMTRDILGLIVENITGVSEDEYTMELIYESQLAVVTFTNPDNVKKFQTEAKLNKKFQNYNLTERVLERTCSLRMECLPPNANKDLIELYCEKQKVEVKSVALIPEENAAVVTFQKPEDIVTMLNTQHKISKVEVSIHPYYKSLGTALCGKDRPRWKIPDSFSVSIHQALLEFLQNKKLPSHINDQMQAHHCQVSMKSIDVLLSPLPTLLKMKGLTAKHIDGWKENTSDAFHQIMSKYGTLEKTMNPDVCSSVAEELLPMAKDHVVMKMDPIKGQLTLAGMTKDIDNLRQIVDGIVNKTTNKLERERNSVEQEMDLPADMFKLLQLDGLSQYMAASCPQVSLDYKLNRKKMILSGLTNEVLIMKTWVLEKRMQMKQLPVELDRHIVEFLMAVDSEMMSDHLFFSRGIHAIYVIKDRAVFLTGSSERSLNESMQRMKETLAFRVLTVEDGKVLSKSEWKTLNTEVLSMYNTPGKISLLKISSNPPDSLIVTGFIEPVKEASQILQEFLQDHARVVNTVKVKCCAAKRFIEEHKSEEWKRFTKVGEVVVIFDPKRPRIKLSGERTYVKPAVDAFKKMVTSLFIDELKVCKPGAKKYFQEQGSLLLSMMVRDHRCVVLLQDDSMLEDEDEDEDDERSDGKFSTFSDSQQGYCEVKMPCGVLIAVSKADICKFQADAVVNAANEDLKHIGGLALALLNAAGRQLQSDCDRYTSKHGPLRPGDAIITEAGRLPCKHVVHAVGPRFSDTDRKTAVQRLTRAITESLNRASGANCTSIAIPAISSGIFGFPLDLCTDTIATAVREYFERGHQQGRNSLNKVYLLNNDDRTVNAMVQAVEKVFHDMNPRSEFPQQATSRRPTYSGSGNHGPRNQWEGEKKWQSSSTRPHSEKYNHGPGNQWEGEKKWQSSSTRPHSEKYNHGPGNQWEGEKKWQSSSAQPHSEGWTTQPDTSGVLESKQTSDGVRILLKKGSIQDASTEVVVNTVAENLNLTQGAVSNALLRAAGPQLQSAASDEARGGRMSYGEMVITDGFNLRCRKVFHTVCPPWDHRGGKSEEVLKTIIKDCLREVDKRGLASLTFPAIGTGNLGFPKDLVPRIMLEETEMFCKKINPQRLREVVIIVHPSDQESVDCFRRAFQGGRKRQSKAEPHGINKKTGQGFHKQKAQQPSGLWGQVKTTSLGIHSVRIGHLTLEVSSGDITKEATDVIVNSSNSTFSLKSGVSMAILEAAGPSVEAECSEFVSSPNFQSCEMILTMAGKLPCKHIVHLVGRNNPSDITNNVCEVLTFCEKRKFTSVSFPALGTGQGGASASAVADAMIEAIVSFVKKTKSQHIRSVKILIFQTNMVSVFHQSLLARQAKGGEDDKGVLEKFKDFAGAVVDFFSPGRSEEQASDDEEFVMVGEEFAPAIFQLCGETSQEVKRAKDCVTSLIMKEQTSTQIQDPLINRFTQEDSKELQDLQRELTVSIRVDQRRAEPVIYLEGLTRDVFKVEGRIRDMIRRADRKETTRKEAFIISTLVEWQYLDRNNQLVPFDMYTNMTLEQAFQTKMQKVTINIGSHKYEADLVGKVASNGRNDIELKRVDRKDASVSLPNNWDDMKGKIVVQIQLKAGTNEYNDVEKEFRTTGITSNIIQIDRVQNSTLWRNYMIKKEELDQRNKHTNNEKRLWHGTSANKIDQINNQGFNRSFAGSQVGARYGNGSYFAVDPQYSASGYARADGKGHKRMYLARVLVGEFTLGSGGLLTAPARNSGSSADLYDSVTDNMTNPTMFVIFSDVQAYPEYIITFQ
ncbi:protein mono-ADP-ribosyltransferase PARP14-like isoform X3 [Alosa sapidissima]|uniref:protein mono-ADP-ribosyltransferase PARP14-like isoform X3 n=1 Tax=Alosa sapidissima TaxID=34773 RepID=UPI001C082A24|nr:protein mono-ADP-ribosyltransferase PARP14-like isoform X3 [Alosa sapidissima]